MGHGKAKEGETPGRRDQLRHVPTSHDVQGFANDEVGIRATDVALGLGRVCRLLRRGAPQWPSVNDDDVERNEPIPM